MQAAPPTPFQALSNFLIPLCNLCNLTSWGREVEKRAYFQCIHAVCCRPKGLTISNTVRSLIRLDFHLRLVSLFPPTPLENFFPSPSSYLSSIFPEIFDKVSVRVSYFTATHESQIYLFSLLSRPKQIERGGGEGQISVWFMSSFSWRAGDRINYAAHTKNCIMYLLSCIDFFCWN